MSTIIMMAGVVLAFGVIFCALASGFIWLAWQETKTALDATRDELNISRDKLHLEQKLRYIAERQTESYSTYIAEMAQEMKTDDGTYPKYVIKFGRN